jgi:hypothetical protein
MLDLPPAAKRCRFFATQVFPSVGGVQKPR